MNRVDEAGMCQPISVGEEMQGRRTRLRVFNLRKGKSSARSDVGQSDCTSRIDTVYLDTYPRTHFYRDQISLLFGQRGK